MVSFYYCIICLQVNICGQWFPGDHLLFWLGLDFPSHIKLVLTAFTLVVYKPLLGLVSIINMISCEFCETKFSRKSSLNRHLKTKHTQQTSSMSIIRHKCELCSVCLLYTSPSPRDTVRSRMPSSA